MKGQPEVVDRQVWGFNLQSPMIPYYDPLKGGTVQITLGAPLCVYHIEVLGCWAELLWIWLMAATVLPHQGILKDESVILTWTSKASAVLCRQYPMSKWDETKCKGKTGVRLYYPDSIFMSQKLLMDFAGDIYIISELVWHRASLER